MNKIEVSVQGWNKLDLDFNKLPNNFVKLKFKSGLTGTLTDQLNKVFYDCDTLGIDAEFVAKFSNKELDDITVWKIDKPEHRSMFLLKFT